MIVGGTDAGSSEIQQALDARYSTVRRIGLTTREGTAAAIAQQTGQDRELDGGAAARS